MSASLNEAIPDPALDSALDSAPEAMPASISPSAIHPFRALAPLQRSWLFVPGLSTAAHDNALLSDCDVIVADLEEMTAPKDRAQARTEIIRLIGKAHACGAYAAVRINKLEDDGVLDLAAVMPGHPDAIFLPHAETVEQIVALDAEITRLETEYDIPHGSTTIIPTIESARGLISLGPVLAASARVRAVMLAVEDLAASLNARRTPEGSELLYARSRFLLEVRATDCLAIDLPCTFRSGAVLANDLAVSTNLGFNAKCAVFPDQIEAIHRAFTPSVEERALAEAIVQRYEMQKKDGGNLLDTPLVDSPDYNNAIRTLERDRLTHRVRRVDGALLPRREAARH